MMDTPSETPPPPAATKPRGDFLGWHGLALLSAIFLVEGLFRFAYFYLAALAEKNDVPIAAPLINELTGSIATVAMIYLVIIPMARRFPLWGGQWKRHLPFNLQGWIGFSGLKTLVMWGLRIPLWQLAGIGPYDYGLMLYRFPMEAANDVLAYLLFVGLVQFWDGWVARQERELREARLESMLHQARLQALQGQLQPHFLFNTLNTISSVMYGDPALADRLISRLSDLLRSSLAAPDRPEVSLEEELEILDRYVELMTARFGDRLSVEVTVSPDARGGRVPVFLLQPLVENAIQHGVAQRAGPGRVGVSVSRLGDELRIVVDDDGPGIDGDPSTAVGKGVGLRNTQERLRHLYPGQAALSLHNGDTSGLTVVVAIPFREATGIEAIDHD